MTLSKLHRPENKIIVGYTTRKHFLVDLDYTSFPKVLNIAFMLIREYPELGDCLIMESSTQECQRHTAINKRGIPRLIQSKNSYHLIFDNEIPYSKSIQIMNTLIDLDILPQRYRTVRAFRGDMTLRVSPIILHDKIKQAPTPEAYIFNYLCEKHDRKTVDYRRFWRNVNLSLFSNSNSECQTDYEGYCTYYATRR